MTQNTAMALANNIGTGLYSAGSAIQYANNIQALNQMNYQSNSAEKAMEFSKIEAEKNRTWQKMMSDTSYQRAVEDLKKAGLNPILAYQNGGASVGSGAAAQGVAMSGAAGKSNDAASLLMAAPAIMGAFASIANSGIDAISKDFFSTGAHKAGEEAGKYLKSLVTKAFNKVDQVYNKATNIYKSPSAGNMPYPEDYVG